MDRRDARPALMRAPRSSLGIRLGVLFVGLAGFSTLAALVFQARALNRELYPTATRRLQSSASVADAMIAGHLSTTLERYLVASRTPEFRANLHANHAPTLAYYAESLREDQGSEVVIFSSPEGDVVAGPADEKLIWATRSPLVEGRGSTCVGTREAGAAAPAEVDSVGPYRSCSSLAGQPTATVFGVSGDLFSVIGIPLKIEGRQVGHLLAAERVSSGLLDRWSTLTGATIRAGPVETAELEVPIRRFPGAEFRASTTFQAERQAIAHARSSLLWSGLAALGLALVMGAFMARSFVRPVLAMRDATHRLIGGDLDQFVPVTGGDELSQLGSAFNELASRLTESQERLERAHRLAKFGNWHLDLDTWSTQGTQEFVRLFDLEGEGPFAWTSLRQRLHPQDRPTLEEAIARSLERGAPFRVDVRVRSRQGDDRVLHLRGLPRGEPAERIEASVQDLTEQRSAAEQIRFLTLYDPLTGLGNRDYLRERLERRLSGPHQAEPLTLLLIGIDGFQGVVDTYDHSVGDALLAGVAQRLVTIVRRISRSGKLEGDREPTDLVAHLGADRFVVTLEGVDGGRDAAAVAQRILASMAKPFAIEEREIAVTASIGIAIWPEDASDAATLLRNCDIALHRRKELGPAGFGFFHESMHADASRRLRVATLLRRAIDEFQLEVHFQPRVDPGSGLPRGFEALSRWTAPELGIVSPAEFIPIAEATGMIQQIGERCLESAASHLRQCVEAGHEQVCVSVNVTQQELTPDLIDRVERSTKGLDPRRFELEVTESSLIEEGATAIEVLAELRQRGYRVALDDFGTGYSSLSYLRSLPIDTVKLDASLASEIGTDEAARALIQSVIAICNALDLHCVVEGIETEAQREVLINLGCAEVQGFLYSRALPGPGALEYLASQAEVGPKARKKQSTQKTKSPRKRSRKKRVAS